MKRFVLNCPPEILLRSSVNNLIRINKLSSSILPTPKNQHLFMNEVLNNKYHRRLYRAALCRELNQLMTIGLKESQPLNSGEVRIQVSAVGVNFGDILMLTGEYQVKLPLPFTPGSEMSGTIVEVAQDVQNIKVGMRVVGLLPSFGAYAEEVVTQVNNLWEIPDVMSFKEAAAFITSYGSAMMGLCRRANLLNGETVLITAAAGAVGMAAVDIAKNVIGAKVIGAAGSDEKCDLVKLKGATATINYQKDNVRSKMKELCPAGAHVVFDAVGGAVFKDALRSISFEGRLVVVGFASGIIPQIPANHLLVKNVSAVGLYWGAYSMNNMKVFKWSVDRCFEEYKKGKLHPYVCTSFGLSEINNAFDFIKNRQSTGKVVVEI